MKKGDKYVCEGLITDRESCIGRSVIIYESKELRGGKVEGSLLLLYSPVHHLT